MANILYVHGFASNHNSGSFLDLQKSIPHMNWYSTDFDLLDVQGTMDKIGELCKELDIQLIIGKSLGGFYTLAYEGPQNKIVINPCIKPWIEIPKLDSSVSQTILDQWQELFNKTEKNINTEQRIKTFGIFGDNDELFSYKDYFDQHYSPENAGLHKSLYVPGKHHINIAELKAAVEKGLDYYNMV